jgi:hypothetical protein
LPIYPQVKKENWHLKLVFIIYKLKEYNYINSY